MRIPLPTILVVSLATAAPALATEVPPPTPLQPAPPLSEVAPVLTCHDTVVPHAGFSGKSARRATRTGTLRGTARDGGCGVAMVEFSIALVKGHGCRLATAKLKLGHRSSCAHNRWMLATGTANWRAALGGLPRGTYRIRIRAIDYAGNVQKPRVRKLTLR
jgi:hypothetical protein